VIVSSESQIELGEWLPKPRSSGKGTPTLEDVERDRILERLQARSGNIRLAAKDLGISRTTLWRKRKEYQVETREPDVTK